MADEFVLDLLCVLVLRVVARIVYFAVLKVLMMIVMAPSAAAPALVGDLDDSAVHADVF